MTLLDDLDGWEDGLDAAAWSPPPAPPRPNPHPVTITVPAGTDPRHMESLHIIAALLEERCPRCYDLLCAEPADTSRPGWRLCPTGATHGWWRRERGGWEWRLGYNPHTGKPSW